MNIFITSTSLLSICLLSSCATIKGFRGDPDTWGKKEKTKEVTKKVERPKQKLVSRTRPTVSASSDNNKVNEMSNQTAKKGRTVAGMIEPNNVTKLPDNKDLQESNNVAPVPLPVTPELISPVAPLLQTAPEIAPGIVDPFEALPPIE